jgi:hypothetical protein
LAALRGVLARSRDGTAPRALQLGQLVDELEEWLADDRQWSHGGARHWRTLVDDVIDRLRLVIALTEGGAQAALLERVRELRELRGHFERGPDEALRRRMRRCSAGIRAVVSGSQLLVPAWRRLATWAVEDPRRAASALGAWRDLAELQGHDVASLLQQLGRVLADDGWAISAIDGSDPPQDADDLRAGRSAADRLAVVEMRLGQPALQTDGLVWLEYLQARLNFPWTLVLGPSVTLYDHAFLRSMIHQAPEDKRIPPELRGDLASSNLPLWLDASDPDEATRADHEVPGDPRVYIRLQLGTMPPAQLLVAARETAEFLVGFGMLNSDAHDIWVLGESHYIAGHVASSGYTMLNEDQARDQLAVDGTAVELGRNADALARHLPLTDSRLRVAGRLLVWMRQATANDDPARIVLCERVIEQVCGWAGMAVPARFIEDHLKPSWIYWQIRGTAQNGYWQVRRALGDDPLRALIETDAAQPPYSAGNVLPTTSTKAILEHLDELIVLGADARGEAAGLIEFRERHGRPCGDDELAGRAGGRVRPSFRAVAPDAQRADARRPAGAGNGRERGPLRHAPRTRRSRPCGPPPPRRSRRRRRLP